MLTLLVGVQAADAGVVFFTNFESGLPAQFGGAGATESTQNFPTQVPAFGATFLRNSTFGGGLAGSTLTINSLPAHTNIGLSFLLAVIDTWDGTGGPDTFNVAVDSVPIFSSAYSNADSGDPYQGTRLFWAPDAGFTTNGDSAYQLGVLIVPHTASSVVIEFTAGGSGWQGGTDESWAIDNVEVSTDIPEPGTIGLLFPGAAAIVALRRRRQK